MHIRKLEDMEVSIRVEKLELYVKRYREIIEFTEEHYPHEKIIMMKKLKATVESDINYCIQMKKYDSAEGLCELHKEMFGKGDIMLELMYQSEQ